MKLRDTKWRTLVSSITLGGKQYRVIRPARSPAHAPLYQNWFGAQLTVDKAATLDLASAWWLATRSRRSIVFLPLRSGNHTCGEENGGPRLDLVMLHHSLGFPVSRWKEVRARLSTAVPHTVRLPAQPFPELTPTDYEPRSWHRGFHDHLRWNLAADTLFLIGSRKAFELDSDPVRWLAEESPGQVATRPNAHNCAEIILGRLRRAGPDGRTPPITLHIECCQHHW